MHIFYLLEEEMEIPMRYKVIIKMLEPFNIFSGLRAAGPLGPKLLHKVIFIFRAETPSQGYFHF